MVDFSISRGVEIFLGVGVALIFVHCVAILTDVSENGKAEFYPSCPNPVFGLAIPPRGSWAGVSWLEGDKFSQ